MIYVNGTEMKTSADLYINGTAPSAVYCNGTLVWAELVSTTFMTASPGGYLSTTLTYYQQPGASTKTVSTEGTISFDARSNTSISVSMTATGLFYPNSYRMVTPGKWDSTSQE